MLVNKISAVRYKCGEYNIGTDIDIDIWSQARHRSVYEIYSTLSAAIRSITLNIYRQTPSSAHSCRSIPTSYRPPRRIVIEIREIQRLRKSNNDRFLFPVPQQCLSLCSTFLNKKYSSDDDMRFYKILNVKYFQNFEREREMPFFN